MKNLLQKELDFYIANQEELLKNHNGKYLVIKGQKVVGVYDTTTEAYNDSKSKYELGTFLIQKCEPGSESYTQVYHSRAIF